MDNQTQSLVDAAVQHSGVHAPDRMFCMVSGLNDEGDQVFSEVWINLNDPDNPISAWDKVADLAFAQQGLVVQSVLDNLGGE
ncbi:hypothetical protein YH66_09670 [[Brevibacterium] flavum]|uniref:Uncharacterized protein n=1 Tax=[Brevibacterium] flavum TaxID=92706 RepID=A0A0F6SRE1_9CORY|nr:MULTISPECIES: hypothetical protein [Corynebacterium]AKF27799.1 hypothetical protein YH66_09670 [[Brevibacterium] flavum]ANE08630.1 hypothetical protein A3654_09730 [Corynebacterium glutamicum]AST21043.1 hypothetical protein CEY17_09810 [Corynebacterium glutamicum ATCC 14067]KEI23552.1 hypothetical protein KIQ_013580 [Corynebacterium glutamicum ATCC 14067]KIH73300.1 hypothetical protein SD36_09700 [Corynebacterium glutamicum]